MRQPWSEIEPRFQALAAQSLTPETLPPWLGEWSRWSRLLNEAYQRLYVGVTTHTDNAQAEQAYNRFVDEVLPAQHAAEQTLKEKLLASGLQPPDFEIPLRNLRAQADLFRAANLPLLSEDLKLANEYERIVGAQTVEWEGQTLTIQQLQAVYLEPERPRRERAWRLVNQRQLEDRQALDKLWGRMMALRGQIAANADLPSYREYRWRHMLRFDYSPADCLSFHAAIEQEVTPAATRLYEKRRRRLGVPTLRPWDVEADPRGLPPLKPFQEISTLETRSAAIFRQVDPQLGEYFDVMRAEALLDLDNRPNKAPGGYCTDFAATQRPFIFANAVGVHDDVQTLLHEGGHAFHVFESIHLPYHLQQEVTLEFAEVASMGMEFLAAPYLELPVGFYTPAQAARARIDTLERALFFWPYMAVVDSFQHWVYENPIQGSDPAACDAAWTALWQRFIPGQDWSGLADELATGWLRKAHIFTDPFYYVDYGLAQLGAVQVWANSLEDQPAAVAAYRRALALGGSAALPQLFAAAGARLAFDAETLGKAVALMEKTIDELEALQ
jgi:oligoendopeptidase F